MKRFVSRIPAWMVAAALVLGVLAASPAQAVPTLEQAFPKEPDPFSGNWTGKWSDNESVDPAICAQVIAMGGNKYQIRLVPKMNVRCNPNAVLKGRRWGNKIAFHGQGYYGLITKDGITGGRESGKYTFQMKKFFEESPTMGAKAPKDAIKLFDGSNLDAWDGTEGVKITSDGLLMMTPDAKYLISKQKFTDVMLHVEFRLSYLPKEREQGRGNSGVFLQDEVEIQVLDSFGLEGYYNECGALYKAVAPLVNACLPPLEWQTYDITYRAPKFDESGKCLKNAVVSVKQNGVPIHINQELPWTPGYKEKDRVTPLPNTPGSIRLQGHHNFTQYRNIWVRELKPKK